MDKQPKQPSLFSLLKPYRGLVLLLIALTLISNGLNLWIPMMISQGIDAFLQGGSVLNSIVVQFSFVAVVIFVFTFLQSIVQTYASERVARDLRRNLSAKISSQSYAYVQKVTPAKLLTNLTADIDSIKSFVSQAIASIVSSLFIIIGGSILLLSINWRLALAVLVIIPIIGGTFFYVLTRVRALFKKTREFIDRINNIINESILGAALIRVLNSQQPEYEKFLDANTKVRDLGTQILRLFAAMIPVVTFASNLAILIILTLGGHFVISGTMTLGNFAAFNSYLSILIFPIFILGFMSNIIAQAQASYERITETLNAPETELFGNITHALRGEIALQHIMLNYSGKPTLKDVSLHAKSGTKTAIIGPTAAGKTQLLNLLIGLIEPDSGNVNYDGKNIHEYDRENLYKQIGFVFQDSIVFNMSLGENIAFNTQVTQEDLWKAIETAELGDFIESLPDKLDTLVSERGVSLSGGQKQRVMLARALALNPKILLLDDFTARVDANTEKKILDNLMKNYPGLTLLSVTQKIASVEHYDQIVLLMEGEVIATGTHTHLMRTAPEYVQIYNSQQSISTYELQPS